MRKSLLFLAVFLSLAAASPPAPPSTPTEIVTRFVNDFQHERLAAIQAYVTDDYAMDLPFAAPGHGRLDGKAMASAYLQSVFDKYTRIAMRDVTITPAADGHTVLLEARADFTEASGAIHSVGYVWVMKVDGGKLSHARTYLIPIEG